jgi:hypothetical protein
MDCFCGCGRKLRRGQIDLGLQAPKLALELLAWDKARAGGQLGSAPSDNAEHEIARGSDCYRRLIGALHGESGGYSIEEGESWLRESADERAGRPYMTVKGRFFEADKLLLTTEDEARLDRARPERSFTGTSGEDGGGDRVKGQLERLGALRAEGVLTDEEFAAAKARVLQG